MLEKIIRETRKAFYSLPVFQHANAHEVTISPDNLAEIPKLTYWSQRKPFLRINLPAKLLVMEGGFHYSAPCNPFVAMLDFGREALIHHYENFTPTKLHELYNLPKRGLNGEELATNLVCWMLTNSQKMDTGEWGLGPEHGRSYFGPVSDKKQALEFRRLEGTRDSIVDLPTRHGDITGYFIRRGDEFRFLVRGGKHRAAVLAHLGNETIPVRMKPGWPRMIDRLYAHEWPHVQSGAVDKTLALDIFDKFFESQTLQDLYDGPKAG